MVHITQKKFPRVAHDKKIVDIIHRCMLRIGANMVMLLWNSIPSFRQGFLENLIKFNLEIEKNEKLADPEHGFGQGIIHEKSTVIVESEVNLGIKEPC